MKIHFRCLHVPFCGEIWPASGQRSPPRLPIWIRLLTNTNCDAHLTESNFQTRSKAFVKAAKKGWISKGRISGNEFRPELLQGGLFFCQIA
ncbi:DUF6783 domain-containing protein [Lachnospiraceae bacterium 45-P1]